MTTLTRSVSPVASPVASPVSPAATPTNPQDAASNLSDPATIWERYFSNWPAKMPRSGVVTTTLDEHIPYADFQTGQGFLLLDRRAPDSMGSRQVIVPYANLVAHKVTDVVDKALFQKMGFKKRS